jgi:hypothetical protein
MPRVRKAKEQAPERPPLPRLIHFASGRLWAGGFHGRPASDRTYCGARFTKEPDTDTRLEKVTCKRCVKIRKKELRPKMREVRVSYRAELMGLKQGVLNAIGAKFNSQIAIEIFKATNGFWKFRAPHNGAELPELGQVAGSVEAAQLVAEEEFEKVSSPWVMIGDAGDGKGRRELDAEEVVIKQGKVYVYVYEDEASGKKGGPKMTLDDDKLRAAEPGYTGIVDDQVPLKLPEDMIQYYIERIERITVEELQDQAVSMLERTKVLGILLQAKQLERIADWLHLEGEKRLDRIVSALDNLLDQMSLPKLPR